MKVIKIVFFILCIPIILNLHEELTKEEFTKAIKKAMLILSIPKDVTNISYYFKPRGIIHDVNRTYLEFQADEEYNYI